jgi:SAM-dependent methyltransferase
VNDPGRPAAEQYSQRLLEQVPLFRATVRSAECQVFAAADIPTPVLDIGCGDGTFAYALNPGGGWTGLDPAHKPLREAARLGAYDNVVQGVGAPLPFKDGAFASVVSNSALEHIPDLEPVLAEMVRVLRPGGTFAVSFPSDEFYDFYLGTIAFEALRLKALARGYRRFVKYTARVHHAEGPDSWLPRLQGLGLEIVTWRYYFSRRNTSVMDAAHYLSAPSLITHALLNRWVLWPQKARVLPIARWVQGISAPGPTDTGSFLYILCRKPT